MDKPETAMDFEHIQHVKIKYEGMLLRKANVVSVGIGMPVRKGKPVGEPGIVVGVTRKLRIEELAPEDVVPQWLDDVRVWVEEIGQPRARE